MMSLATWNIRFEAQGLDLHALELAPDAESRRLAGLHDQVACFELDAGLEPRPPGLEPFTLLGAEVRIDRGGNERLALHVWSFLMPRCGLDTDSKGGCWSDFSAERFEQRRTIERLGDLDPSGLP